MTGYAELQVTTNFSFLRGASHVEELFAQAKLLGLAALGITDRNSLAGIVRAHRCAAETGIRVVVGCRLDLRDGTALLVYPTDRTAYSRLCRLLTLGKARAGKGKCDLCWQDLAAHAEGLLAILLPDAADAELSEPLARGRASAISAGRIWPPMPKGCSPSCCRTRPMLNWPHAWAACGRISATLPIWR